MPAAALRGLAKSGFLASPSSALIRSKSSSRKKTSPRTSSHAGRRVAAQARGHAADGADVGGDVLADGRRRRGSRLARSGRSRRRRATDRPSILGSTTTAGSRPSPLTTRVYHALSSVASKALSSESRRFEWATGAKSSLGAAPTRWVGESGGDELGVAALERLQLAHELVVFGVRHLGLAEHVVAVAVVLELRRGAPRRGSVLPRKRPHPRANSAGSSSRSAAFRVDGQSAAAGHSRGGRARSERTSREARMLRFRVFTGARPRTESRRHPPTSKGATLWRTRNRDGKSGNRANRARATRLRTQDPTKGYGIEKEPIDLVKPVRDRMAYQGATERDEDRKPRTEIDGSKSQAADRRQDDRQGAPAQRRQQRITNDRSSPLVPGRLPCAPSACRADCQKSSRGVPSGTSGSPRPRSFLRAEFREKPVASGKSVRKIRGIRSRSPGSVLPYAEERRRGLLRSLSRS